MAWQIAIVLDEETKALIREMPVWALETPARREQADEIRDSVKGFWDPEPSFTLFNAGGLVSPLEILRSVVGTVLEHHPRAACLHLIGIPASQELAEIMRILDFEVAGGSEDSLIFRKPTAKILDVPELVIDARSWTKWNDIYDSVFQTVGAPEWHGRNLNALNDSIVTGGVNKIEVPYVLAIVGLDHAGPEGIAAAHEFVSFMREIGDRGCPVSVLIRD